MGSRATMRAACLAVALVVAGLAVSHAEMSGEDIRSLTENAESGLIHALEEDSKGFVPISKSKIPSSAEEYKSFKATLAKCQKACSEDSKCKGVKHVASTSQCVLISHDVTAIGPAGGKSGKGKGSKSGKPGAPAKGGKSSKGGKSGKGSKKVIKNAKKDAKKAHKDAKKSIKKAQ